MFQSCCVGFFSYCVVFLSSCSNGFNKNAAHVTEDSADDCTNCDCPPHHVGKEHSCTANFNEKEHTSSSRAVPAASRFANAIHFPLEGMATADKPLQRRCLQKRQLLKRHRTLSVLLLALQIFLCCCLCCFWSCPLLWTATLERSKGNNGMTLPSC